MARHNLRWEDIGDAVGPWPILPGRSEDVLRIAMTASDIPTATGVPNNGFEGYRFLGLPPRSRGLTAGRAAGAANVRAFNAL
jgi:hypothetical protein